MGLPVGTIWECSYRGTLLGQRILTRFHYRTVTPSNAATAALESGEIALAFGNQAIGFIGRSYSECMPENYMMTQVVVQAIRNIRYARRVVNVANAGLRTAAFTANTSARITWGTAFAGRPFIGGTSLPIGPDDYAAGFILPGLKAAMETLIAQRLLNITPAGSPGVYEPVLIHPPPGGIPTTALTTGYVQDTVRTMRRRTVGLGE